MHRRRFPVFQIPKDPFRGLPSKSENAPSLPSIFFPHLTRVSIRAVLSWISHFRLRFWQLTSDSCNRFIAQFSDGGIPAGASRLKELKHLPGEASRERESWLTTIALESCLCPTGWEPDVRPLPIEMEPPKTRISVSYSAPIPPSRPFSTALLHSALSFLKSVLSVRLNIG